MVHRGSLLLIWTLVLVGCSNGSGYEPTTGSRITEHPEANTVASAETTANDGTPSQVARLCDRARRLGGPNSAVRCLEHVVSATTLDELAREVDTLVDPRDGVRSAAYTRWYVHWSYDYHPVSSEICRIGALGVSLRLTIRAPRWKPGTAVESSVIELWNTYTSALWRHELGHVQNGQEAARDIERKLASLGNISCAQLEAEANAASSRILRKHRAWDRRYDQTTGHGAAQGAELG